MPRIYTRTGDEGKTGLLSGKRVSKDDPLIEAVGSVDELNSFIGVAAVHITDELLSTILRRIQSELFVIGADMSSTGKKIESIPSIKKVMIERLEREIDGMTRQMPEQTSFILPGGGMAGADLYLARAVARRAERRMVKASSAGYSNPLALAYMNRLCDFLHVAARFINHREGVEEHAPDYEK